MPRESRDFFTQPALAAFTNWYPNDLCHGLCITPMGIFSANTKQPVSMKSLFGWIFAPSPPGHAQEPRAHAQRGQVQTNSPVLFWSPLGSIGPPVPSVSSGSSFSRTPFSTSFFQIFLLESFFLQDGNGFDWDCLFWHWFLPHRSLIGQLS